MSLTNNKAIALNIFLHAPYNSKKIRSAYFSKQFKAYKSSNSLDHY